MFEFWPQEKVTLLLPSGTADGETQFETVIADAIMTILYSFIGY